MNGDRMERIYIIREWIRRELAASPEGEYEKLLDELLELIDRNTVKGETT